MVVTDTQTSQEAGTCGECIHNVMTTHTELQDFQLHLTANVGGN